MTHGPAYLPTEIQYISDHENSRYPRNSLKSKWVLCLCTAFSKIIGIWVRLSLALIQWKKKNLFQLWSGPTQTHHNFFDLKILINPHPLLVDELQRIQRMVDLVKEMRQDIFHRDLRQLQGCKYVGWTFLQHQSPTHPVWSSSIYHILCSAIKM